jgi:hypothetical protein
MLIPVTQTEVRATETLKVDILDILIDQCHLMMIGNKSRQQSKAGNGQVGPLPEELHRVLQPPK